MDKEARDYLNQISEEAGTVCSAVVIKSSFAKMLANLFLQISKPSYPTKIFTEEEKAVEWIRQIAAR